MNHARFKILKHVFLENEARLVLLNLALNFFFSKKSTLEGIRYPCLKVAYYSFCTMRALIYARAAQGTRKHHACAKLREPAEEIPRAQKQNGGSRKNFLVFQVGFRGVLTVASCVWA